MPSKTAQGRRPAKVAAPPVHVPTVWDLELGSDAEDLVNDLASARQERLAGERLEKPLKEQLKALYEPECEDLEKGDTLRVLVDGEIRGTVTRHDNSQPTVDWDLLLDAFPEAYEACVEKGTHLRFNPA